VIWQIPILRCELHRLLLDRTRLKDRRERVRRPRLRSALHPRERPLDHHHALLAPEKQPAAY
jgi:hypothetical protein